MTVKVVDWMVRQRVCPDNLQTESASNGPAISGRRPFSSNSFGPSSLATIQPFSHSAIQLSRYRAISIEIKHGFRVSQPTIKRAAERDVDRGSPKSLSVRPPGEPGAGVALDCISAAAATLLASKPRSQVCWDEHESKLAWPHLAPLIM